MQVAIRFRRKAGMHPTPVLAGRQILLDQVPDEVGRGLLAFGNNLRLVVGVRRRHVGVSFLMISKTRIIAASLNRHKVGQASFYRHGSHERARYE